jgi:hypothetical protein
VVAWYESCPDEDGGLDVDEPEDAEVTVLDETGADDTGTPPFIP